MDSRLTKAISRRSSDGVAALVLEPLHTAVGHPGYVRSESAAAFGVVDEVDSSQVKPPYDDFVDSIFYINI